jgi:hypothetical protein
MTYLLDTTVVWTLVTRNTADLARCGVALLDPFDPSAT